VSAPSILLAAVEPSGDALGAALYRELDAKLGEAEFFGCGGDQMAAVGFDSLFPTDAFAVMGFTDVARALPEGFRRAKELAEEAAKRKAVAAVLIDGWAFSRIAAKRLRKLSPETKIYKFAAPQVWASRPQRVDFVKDYFDGVLTLLPFEPPYFERVGVPAAFVGNPTFQKAWRERGDGAAFRVRHDLGDKTLLAVLPGSRKSEVAHLTPVFSEVIEYLTKQFPDLHVIAPVADAVAGHVRQIMAGWAAPVIVVDTSEKYDALAAADAALAASGTVSTELAINGTPMAVAYRADAITAFWARRVVTTKYASILNVMADEFVIPEFIQEDCTADKLTKVMRTLLTDEQGRERQKQHFQELLPQLRLEGEPAAGIAADRIIAWMTEGGS